MVQLRLRGVERQMAHAPSGEKRELAQRRTELQAELARVSARAMEASSAADPDR
jgi:hypothetical protein